MNVAAKGSRAATRLDRIASWSVRVAWLVAALAASGTSPAWWVGWSIVAAATIVLHPVSLSVVRIVAPLVALETAADATGDARFVVIAAAVATGVIVSFGAEYGRSHVQAAAYGAEYRHLLRPPVSALLVSIVAWLVVAASVVVRRVVAGDSLTTVRAASVFALSVLLGAALAYRAATLARRWFVVVPAGLVIHDPLLLTDSIMIPRGDVTSLDTDTSAPVGALDVTGTTWGAALVVSAREACDVALTDFGARLTGSGTRLHAGAVRFAPSRPGAALTDATR